MTSGVRKCPVFSHRPFFGAYRESVRAYPELFLAVNSAAAEFPRLHRACVQDSADPERLTKLLAPSQLESAFPLK